MSYHIFLQYLQFSNLRPTHESYQVERLEILQRKLYQPEHISTESFSDSNESREHMFFFLDLGSDQANNSAAPLSGIPVIS
jgi:hypothetical protein